MSNKGIDIDALFSDITTEVIENIMVGGEIDVRKFKDIDKAKKCAIHCILNGPVGTGKSTNFPGIPGEFKLKDLYKERLTNKIWRNFCELVAEWLVRTKKDVCDKSQQKVVNGNVWPLWTYDQ
jgi:predicted AAA+ superfamily ATPase